MGSRDIIKIEENASIQIEQVGKSFRFDRVFGVNATQHEVFQVTALPLVHDVMQGFNATIFAYGQTGSGKTYSMMGDAKSEKTKGIIPRLVDSIFQSIEDADHSMEFTVKLSYVEIYMERIRDLLDPEKNNLKIRESSRGVWIQDVTENYVVDYDQVLDNMLQGQHNRAIASTNMNLESSRSHSVFMFTLGQTNKQTGSKKKSKLILVDLAGSESVGKTGAHGHTLNEAKHINKSLSALGNVINALSSSSGANSHIPYRDSKLTRLLSDSLGGNSKTCLIITCSPAGDNKEETLSTCRFGNRAKNIKNKPKVNQEKSVSEYKRLLNEAYRTIKTQKSRIEAIESDKKLLITALEKNNIDLPDLDAISEVISEGEPEVAGSLKRPLVIDSYDGGMDTSLKTEYQKRISDMEKDNLDLKEQVEERTKMIQQEKQEAFEKEKEWEAKLANATEYCRNTEEIKNQLEGEREQNKLLTRKIEAMERERQLAEEQQRKTMTTFNEKLAVGELIQRAAEEARDSAINQLRENNIEIRHQPQVKDEDDSDDPNNNPEYSEQMLTDLINRKKNVSNEQLLKFMNQKCQQYIELEKTYQTSKEKYQSLEKKMDAENQKNLQQIRERDKKLMVSETKREKVEQYCKKLLESGLFWRARRRAMPQAKIVMPIKGGQGRKRQKNSSVIVNQ